MRIFVDRIAWIALADKDDPNHSIFKEQFKYYLDGGHNFYTTNVIVGNVISHVKETQGGVRANKFYDILEEAWLGTHLHFLWIGRRTQRDAVKLFKKFPEEKLSLFDAANIVLMNRRNIRFIMTTNSAYSKMGFKMIPEN
jgi:predicted nucleic acid-binding protein